MFWIGCIGFGGGSALIPVIEKEIADRQGIDEKQNIDKDVVVASITPGALPVEIAASIGRRKFGIRGMIAGAVMMALPGALMTVALQLIYQSRERTGTPQFCRMRSLRFLRMRYLKMREILPILPGILEKN